MPSRETLPIPERRTDLSSGRDIARRLVFVLLNLGLLAGASFGIFGFSRSRPALAIVGGLVLIVSAGLWWRCRTQMAVSSDEIEKNPFKPRHEPKE